MRVESPGRSRRYIDRHNHGYLDGRIELVAEDINFTRDGDDPLRGSPAVRRQLVRCRLSVDEVVPTRSDAG
jgi:hypothetical protein